jgi:hypothetical protein
MGSVALNNVIYSQIWTKFLSQGKVAALLDRIKF